MDEVSGLKQFGISCEEPAGPMETDFNGRTCGWGKAGTVTKDGQNSVPCPEIKAWVDNCLVPILVKQYLAEPESQKELAPAIGTVAESNDTSILTGVKR